ncbi:MAG: ribonuclease PH, partial [Planctomycetota bacterium]
MRRERKADELRAIRVEVGFTKSAPGSVLFSIGRTKVLATVSFVKGVPEFLVGTGKGWLTAEYGMLPGSVRQRKRRDRGAMMDGRSVEIQRLIGRSLRAAMSTDALGENTLYADCDVLEADGGTRVACISASSIALGVAMRELARKGKVPRELRVRRIAAVSVGIVKGEALLDLDAEEDRQAEVDMNVVMLGARKFIEVQGTAEHQPFGDAELRKMLALARKGILR